MRGNSHVRCEVGENLEITSKDYLSLSLSTDLTGGGNSMATKARQKSTSLLINEVATECQIRNIYEVESYTA